MTWLFTSEAESTVLGSSCGCCSLLFAIFSSGVSGNVASGVWLEVLSSDCSGGCDEVAVGVPCPHGIELPGKDSWPCGVQCGLAFSVAGGGAKCMIGRNVELGLGIKPEVDGRGFCGSGYIPLLLSCFSIRLASLVILSMTAGVSNS